jgi:alpha-tubulin suppressor-like RCC1 family protein
LWCWGANGSGQLGDGTRMRRLLPVQVGTAATWAQVSVGNLHTCAVQTNGTLWCWGSDGSGELGEGIGNLGVQTAPRRVGNSTTWTNVAAGTGFTCGVDAAALYCWGNATASALGYRLPVGDHPIL